MANQHIQFQIGSAFSGEGFKQAQAATGRLKAGVNQGAEAVGQLSTAMGGMDGKVGAAARAMTGMISTFMTLNPVMIGVTAAITALTFAYNEHKKGVEELKKWTDDLKESMTKMRDASSQSFTDTVLKRIREVSSDFERITKHANDMTAAMNGLANARSSGGVIAIQAEKLQAVMDEVTAEAKQLKAAEYDLKIATAKAAEQRAKAQQDLDKAHKTTVDTQNEIEMLERQRMSTLTAIGIIEKRMAENKADGLKTEEADNKRLAALRAELASIDAKTVKTKDRLEVELVNEQTAAQKMANATISAQMEVDAASGKIAELKNASAAAAEAERKAAAAEFVRAQEMEQQRDLQKEAADVQKKVNEAAQDVAQAERDYAAALAEFEKNYAENSFANDIMNGGENGGKNKMAIPVRISGRVMADVQAKDLENAIQNGVVRNVRDMDKFIRDNARKRAAEETKQWNQLKVERQRYERLRQLNRKTWSKADADFVQKFEKLKAAADAKVQEVKDAKARLAAAKQREEENHENLKKIKQRLEKLGLK